MPRGRKPLEGPDHPALTPEERVEVVLALLRREEAADLARRYKVRKATIYQWRDAFLAAGKAAMARDVWRSKWGKRLFWPTLVLVPASLVSIIRKWAPLGFVPETKISVLDIVLYAVWTVVPPVWFFVEYDFLFERKNQPLALEDMKYTQELAGKVWAGLIVLFGLLLLLKYHIHVG